MSRFAQALALMFTMCFAGDFVSQAHAQTSGMQYTLGDKNISVRIHRGGGKNTCVAIHDDENTAVSAGRTACSKLIELVYGGSRNVSFTLNGKKYSFDPNRMFTAGGLERSLKAQGKNYSQEAHKAASGFARWFLSIINKNKSGLIVALHNNSNGAYSLDSYLSGNLKGESSPPYKNRAMDPDDFVFTTSSSVFAKMKAKKINVVLQSRGATDDGSLSVYFGGSSYVNVEAQDGHLAEQVRMLRAL